MLNEHEQEFLNAMGNITWASAGVIHRLPHPTYIEKHIRTLKHVKYDSYYGEYFSCRICLEKIKSWKAAVSALGDEHKKWSSKCSNATCPCGAFQHNKNAKLRSEVY